MSRSPTPPAGRSLWRHRDFLLLWAGQTVSDLGSAVTLLAIPLVAITTLQASTVQVGVLGALTTLGWLVVPLPAGLIVDRVSKRRLMIRCDIVRAVTVGSIPVAAAVDALTLAHLYLAALVAGVCTVFFEIAWQSHTPTVLAPAELTAGNSRIATTNALSSVAGPGLTGGLVALVGEAARVLVIDSVSYVVSAVSLALVRAPDPATRSRHRDLTAGLRFVLRHPLLRRIVACSATSNMFDAMTTTLVVVFLVREVHLSPSSVGLVLGAAGIGGMFGGAFASPAARRIGGAKLLWLGKACLGWLALLTPLAQPGLGAAFVAVGLFATSFSFVLYNVLQISYRQLLCPPESLGQMNAAVRWLIRGLIPIGSLLAGILADFFGIRATLAIAAAGSWFAVLWVVCSPFRKLRDLPRSSETST